MKRIETAVMLHNYRLQLQLADVYFTLVNCYVIGENTNRYRHDRLAQK